MNRIILAGFSGDPDAHFSLKSHAMVPTSPTVTARVSDATAVDYFQDKIMSQHITGVSERYINKRHSPEIFLYHTYIHTRPHARSHGNKIYKIEGKYVHSFL